MATGSFVQGDLTLTKEIANEVGVHFATVYRWINGWKKSLEGLPLTELPIQDMGMVLTRIEELQKQIDEQECMIAIIHESCVLQNIPLKRRIDIAMKYLDTYSVVQLCRIFEIKPSTLYYHIRIAQNGTRRQQQENLLCSEIKRIFDESGRRLGAEQIRLRLKKQGIHIGKKRIIRLMKQLGAYDEDLEQFYYYTPGMSDLEDTPDVQIL